MLIVHTEQLSIMFKGNGKIKSLKGILIRCIEDMLTFDVWNSSLIKEVCIVKKILTRFCIIYSFE